MKHRFLGGLFLIVIVSLLPMESSSQTITKVVAYTHPIEYLPARFMWSEPTTGTKAIKYIVQHKVDNSDWYNYAITDTNFVWLNAPYEKNSTIRVAGIDAQDKQGPFSVSSDIFNPSIYYKVKENK